jgi:hypothetical protein
MARLTFHPSDEKFFSDRGALIIPVRMEDGGEYVGALGKIIKGCPGVAFFVSNARKLGFLKIGGSYIMVLPNGQRLILLGIDPDQNNKDASIKSALESVGKHIEREGFSELALFAPTKQISQACRQAGLKWPSSARVNIYERGNHVAAAANA